VDISTSVVKELREKTGAGVMDCKRALQEANGNVERAVEILRDKGMAALNKKSGREANQGVIDTYIHAGGRIGAMVEVNCETDFVARTDDFRNLAHDIAMQVAAMSPREVGDMSPDGDTSDETLLVNQSFIKNPRLTIRQLVHEAVMKLGENIVVSRFTRFEVGGAPAAEEQAAS